MNTTKPLCRFGLPVAFLVIGLFLSPLPGLAWVDGIHYWGDNDGKLIVSRTSPYTVGDCQVVSDGNGGAFFVFLDITDLNPTTFSAVLRVQRRDYDGNGSASCLFNQMDKGKKIAAKGVISIAYRIC